VISDCCEMLIMLFVTGSLKPYVFDSVYVYTRLCILSFNLFLYFVLDVGNYANMLVLDS